MANYDLDLDVGSMCRVCSLQKEKLYNLFSNCLVEGIILPLPAMIRSCLELEVFYFKLKAIHYILFSSCSIDRLTNMTQYYHVKFVIIVKFRLLIFIHSKIKANEQKKLWNEF